MTAVVHGSNIKVTKELPGGGRAVQVWQLRMHGTPEHDSHHSTLSCVIADYNRISNQPYVSDKNDYVIRDEGANWYDAPEDVKEAMVRMMPEGAKVLTGEGGTLVKRDGEMVEIEVE